VFRSRFFPAISTVVRKIAVLHKVLSFRYSTRSIRRLRNHYSLANEKINSGYITHYLQGGWGKTAWQLSKSLTHKLQMIPLAAASFLRDWPYLDRHQILLRCYQDCEYGICVMIAGWDTLRGSNSRPPSYEFHSPLNLCGVNCVYFTVCWILLCPR